MIIYVRKHEGNYEFRVTIPGHSENMQYSVPISGALDPGAPYLQSHWGSGVKFSPDRKGTCHVFFSNKNGGAHTAVFAGAGLCCTAFGACGHKVASGRAGAGSAGLGCRPRNERRRKGSSRQRIRDAGSARSEL